MDLRRVRDGDWPAKEMVGNPAFLAGRANLKGQSIIYLADSTATALREARIQPEQAYTEARCRVVKPLTLVDIRGQRAAGVSNPFATLDLWMSQPVDRSSGSLEEAERYRYCVTQLFSSIVRHEKFDGLVFSSSVHANGSNFALFDPSNVRVLDVESRRFDRR
jgi:RES domain-containing protein